MKKSTGKFHYGWIMFAFSVLSAFVLVGLALNTLSLYVEPIATANGFPRGIFALKNSISSIIICIIGIFYGKIISRFSLKRVMAFGCACLIICYFIQYYAHTLPLFYLSALFQGVGLGTCSLTGITVIVNNWFSSKFGTLFGAIYTATSIGGAVFFPLIGSIIQNNGYEQSFFVNTGIFVVYLVLLLAVMVDTPDKRGLRPIYADQSPRQAAKTEEATGYTMQQIRKSKTYYAALVCLFLCSMSGAAAQGTMTARMTDVGFELTFATSIVSILYVFASAFKLYAGTVLDKKGLLPVMTFGNLCGVAALVLLILVNPGQRYLAYILTPFLGATMMLITVPVPLIGLSLFGRKAVTEYSGIFLAVQMLGSAVSASFFNYLYDRSGSYVSSYIICIISLVICTTGFIWLFKTNKNWLLEENKTF